LPRAPGAGPRQRAPLLSARDLALGKEAVSSSARCIETNFIILFYFTFS